MVVVDAALGPFAFKPTKAVYDAYSKFVIVLAVTVSMLLPYH